MYLKGNIMASPIHKIRVGAVSIDVFENEGKDYTTQSFKIQKNYKKGEDWKTTDNYNANELMLVITACQQAIIWKYLKEDTPKQTKVNDDTPF